MPTPKPSEHIWRAIADARSRPAPNDVMLISQPNPIVVIGLATHDDAERWARYFGIEDSRSVHSTCGVWYSGEVWGWQFSIRCTVPYTRPPIGSHAAAPAPSLPRSGRLHAADCNVLHPLITGRPCPPHCNDAQHLGNGKACPTCGSATICFRVVDQDKILTDQGFAVPE